MNQEYWMDQLFQTRKSFSKYWLTIIILTLPNIQIIASYDLYYTIIPLTPLLTIVLGLILQQYEIISQQSLMILNDSFWLIFILIQNIQNVDLQFNGDIEEVFMAGQALHMLFCVILMTCQIRSVVLLTILINMVSQIRVLIELMSLTKNSSLRILIIQALAILILLSVVVQLLLMDIELQKADLRHQNYENHTMKVVHDLKNPVLAIQQILKESTDLEQLKKEVNEETLESIEMLDDLRMTFKVQNNMEIKEEPQLICLIDYVNSIKISHVYLADNCKNKIICEVQNNESQTHQMFPRTIVKRILNNFITNSLKHTLKGQVQIKATQLELTNENKFYKEITYIKKENFVKIGKEISQDQNYLKFEIVDTGYGIPKNKINSIFDEMNSDQSGKNWDGCGLGLAICKSLAVKINASIQYKSKVDKGSIFSLYVPIQNNQYNEITNIEVDSNLKIKLNVQNSSNFYNDNSSIDCKISNDSISMKYLPVIIAEDSKILCRTQSKYLQKELIEFQMFMNGQECLEHIKELVSFNKQRKIDQRIMVITDNNMPIKNGIELAKELRSIDSQFQIVLISADDIPENQNNLFDEVFLKPVQLSKLKDCICRNNIIV